jgi:hypothetical protein
MSQDLLTREVLEKYRDKEREIEAEIRTLEHRLGGLHTELQEVRVVRKALEGRRLPAPVGSSDTAAPVRPASVAPPAASAGPAPTGDHAAVQVDDSPAVRKGRRPVGSEHSPIHEMGIVDASIELARQRGVREADAGEILEWFKEIGYKGRHGLPTRNSIYVSLNREFQENAEEKRRVSRPSRGRFVFHFER